MSYYDPLRAQTIPRFHERDIRSYWAAITPPATSLNAPLPQRADYVVIGAGYTGLNAATALAERGKDVVVLDAGAIGAGCSSRNAGFVLPGTGRLGFQDYEQRFGEDVAVAVQNEFAASIHHLQNIAKGVEAELQFHPAQYLRLAHTRQHVAALAAQQPLYEPTLLNPEWLDRDALIARHPGLAYAHGGLSVTPAYSVNPAALVQHTANLAEQAGVVIHSGVAVIGCTQVGAHWNLSTSAGDVIADHVLFCTNGYLPKPLFPELSQRHLPVLSSVMVTAPLSSTQRQALGLSAQQLVMDTRILKYYYRLLPDGRLLFGGRGAIQGKNAQHPRYQRDLYHALTTTLPMLAGIQIEFYWQGWISVALDSMPRVFSPAPNTYAALGYCGAGVAFSALAGRRLASLALNEPLPPLPFYQSELPRFPFAQFRRLGQWGFYQYGRLRDRM
ncbi:MAG: FAD-binding oxidoreductase [Idiomarina sp.]|nr:FAD-binding oxidoreductase [Idiomarina sp.]